MKIARFISYVDSLGIKLYPDGTQLRCKAPSGRLTPALRAKIIEHKAEILTFLRQANQSLDVPIQPIPRDDDLRPLDENLPLSYSQKRLWFLQQLEGDSATYNEHVAIHLTGPLHIKSLSESITEIVRRHEVLRTIFPMKNGEPFQKILPPQRVHLAVVDLQAIPEATEEAEAALFLEVQQVVTREVRQPFDLEHGPLLRVTLLRLAPHSHVLLLTMHHIIWDGWSMGVFIRELSTLYEAFCQGNPSPLPELAIQYADFAHWQRQQLEGLASERLLTYWEEQLADAPPLLELPTDRARPPIQSYQGAHYYAKLPARLLQQIEALTQKEGGTLFMTLQAAFALLLARFSGQSDILIGTPIANRQQVEIEPLIGFFVNTLVLRTQLSGNPTFIDLLAQVRQVALDAYKHQDLPFEMLVEVLQPTRSLSHSPLFQVMFVLQNAPLVELDLAGLLLTPFSVPNHTTKFDLTLSMAESEEGLIGRWEYNTDLFERATIERMTSHFQVLLEAIVANPLERIEQLPLLTESERHQLLVEWNDTKADYPQDKCIHQLFEEQVERTPDACAVVFGDEELTYRELNARANQLAHYLIKQGVGPEVLVGICVERSIEMVVGLLAILKAGGAYVPLDPNYPAQRLAFMLEDAQVKLILTQAELKERLPILREAGVASKQMLLNLDSDCIVETSQENPPVIVLPTNLAYVIYTSGSTGKPKGAMNTHQGIYNRLLWMQDKYQLTPTDSVLQKTPFSFDVSVWEFFWPLMFGARLVVARPEGHKDPAYLVEIISHTQITTLHFVPSMLQLFLEAEGLSRCHFLKRVICSGEALPFDLMQRFFTKLNAELHNLYGPTEAAIDVTYWECEPESQLGIVPIGRPVANTQIYLLDNHLQPVPIGVPGELHIGGVQVARGYLNRPELTEKKFIPNPYDSGRLYKTGDLCRYLPDGNIEFLGRIDHQVKLRGFRIELGEIEAVLSQHPEVREVVVVLDKNGSDQRLVAYLVTKPLSVGAMRTYLKEKVPDYMIPAAFVQLDALPLTPNGKVDRRALPAPTLLAQVETAYVMPQTEVERQIAAVWQEVLGIEKVGIHDNFFDLGGHSLLIIQLYSRLDSRKELAITDLFKYPTIHTLARYLTQQKDFAVAAIQSQDRAEFLRTRKTVAKQRRQQRQKHRNAL